MSADESSGEASRAGGVRHEADIAIVGGGLAGTAAAVVLGRAGLRVVLIDRHAVHLPELRVEKIAGDQVELFARLGLLDTVAAASTAYDEVLNISRGHVVDRTVGRQYGIFYHDLVNAVRGVLPASVPFVCGRVVDIQSGPDRQRVTLADGGQVEARLLVLASGLADALRHKLGIARRIVHEKHSVTFGFSIAPAQGAAFAFPALTSYGERHGDGIDYLNLFPIGEVMRGNLFTFLSHQDPWLREVRREPAAKLLAAMPGLRGFLGDFEVVHKMQNWVMDLYAVEGHRRDGVVIIGDAFRTSCPAAGTGVSRLLTDIERLCTVYVPRWLATPGMKAEKIAQFYDDPVKRAADDHSDELARYRRALTVDNSLRWAVQRRKVRLRRRVAGWIKTQQPELAARIKAWRRSRALTAGKLAPGG